MQKAKVFQIVGELILTAPIFIACCFINLWFECAMIVFGLLFIKSFYESGFHTSRNAICVTISYATIALFLILSTFFKGEYVILLFLCCGLSYLNCELGQLQYKANRFDVIKEPYTMLKGFFEGVETPTAFDLSKCTLNEMTARCDDLRLNKRDTEFCVDVFVNHIGIAEYIRLPKNAELYLDEQQERNRKCKFKKLLSK